MHARRRLNSLLLVASACLGLGLLASSSSAEQGSDDGRRFFEIGVQAYTQAQYGPAIAAFGEAFRLTRRPGLLFSLAQAYRRAYEVDGRPQDANAAIRHYTSYLATNPSGERRQQAEHFLQQLKARAGGSSLDEPEAPDTSRTELVIAATVPEAQLRLDGSLIQRLPHAADVAPGHHVVEVTAAGYLPFKKEVDVGAGEVVALDAELVRSGGLLAITGNSGAEAFVDGRALGPLPVGPLPLPTGLHTVEVRQPGHFTLRQQTELTSLGIQRLHVAGPQTTQRTLAWVLVGAGATGLAAGGVLGYLALRSDNEAQRLERDEPNDYVDFNHNVSSRNTFRLAAGVSAGVGAAATLAGVIAILVPGPGPTRRVAAGSRWAPDLILTGQTVRLGVQGSF